MKNSQKEEKMKGCGKTFFKTERTKYKTSGHNCTCGNNKWNYLCPECENLEKEE